MRMLVLGSAALVGCGDNTVRLPWGTGIATFDAVELELTPSVPADPFATGIAPTTRLVLPTYDGSGQVVHPDVLFERDAGRVLMAMTPYPDSNDRFENPSLLVSEDGTAFHELIEGQNPLVAAPPIDHNDDPDLHRDPVTGEYRLFYLETLRPTAQNLVLLRSPDLVAWTSEPAIRYDLTQGAPFIVSPAAVVKDATTHLFYVHLGEPNLIETLASSDGLTWDAAQAHPIELELGDVTPWHLDVFACPSGYAMLISGYPDEFSYQHLYLATSPDLATWTLRPSPLLAYDDPALEVDTLYRSTGLVLGNQLVVWHSMRYRD